MICDDVDPNGFVCFAEVLLPVLEDAPPLAPATPTATVSPCGAPAVPDGDPSGARRPQPATIAHPARTKERTSCLYMPRSKHKIGAVLCDRSPRDIAPRRHSACGRGRPSHRELARVGVGVARCGAGLQSISPVSDA